jgi:hypothetical protein
VGANIPEWRNVVEKMETEVIVVDIDDLCDDVAPWALPLLDELHRRSGGRFRCTAFTIPGKTSDDTLHKCASRDWLELGVHGWDHNGPECAEWTFERTQEVLAKCIVAGAQHEEDNCYYHAVFKAPHWIAAPAVYVALRDAGWAIADHPGNLLTIPNGLRRYVLSHDHAIGVPHLVLPVIQAHGHFTNEGVSNGIRENFGAFASLAQWGIPYAWVSEVAV